MRVLFVNENIGGHRSVHNNLRSSLVAHPDVEAEFLDVPKAAGFRRAVGTSVPGLGRLDLDLQALRAQLALSGWVRRRLRASMHRFDVVHVYTGNAGLRSADLLASMPSVVSTDATNVTNAYRLPNREPTRFTPRVIKAAQRWETPVYHSASLVVANTEWIARSLRADYAVPEERLRVFPFGIVAPGLADGPAPGVHAGDRLPQLVFVGHQLERKGALRLHRLHQQHLADECELVIVTSEPVPPGRNVRAVHDVTVGSGRLWEVLREAAMFVFPSQIDQAPNAVLEAMAAGLPVVGLQVAAMPDTVPESCGRLVEKDDDRALVAVLRQLVRDPALRAELGANARQRFASEYDAAISTARLVDTLNEARELFAGARSST
ncbi:glycosyltransferase family 4 protein [Nocardioides sp.]|uniref:glycosyltransferase family 4 protein n=1 Tax=Nocardioides sp. TaxID=35761 RepID=UPI002B26908F|nr:glycosyltransferase family 4 protein [Nocardioides sp.]